MKISAAILLAALISVTAWAQDPLTHPNIFPTQPGTFYHGVYPGPYNGWENQVTPTLLATYQNTVGKQAMFVYFTHEWCVSRAFPTSTVAWIDSMGSIPFIRLGMRSRVDITFQQDSAYSLQNIINGAFDADLHAWARAARAYGKTVLAEYGIECNGGVLPWSAVFNGGSTLTGYGDPTLPDGPERFRDAYRHIIDICRSEGAYNIYWFLHVVGYNYPHEGWNLMANYYPGDSYMDGIGLSIYGSKNPADTDCGPFEPMMDYAYPQMAAISSTKPIMVLEFASTANSTVCPGGTWANAAFTDMMALRWPRVCGFSWWDERYPVHGLTQEDDFWVQDDAGITNAFHTWVRDRTNVLARLPQTPPTAPTLAVGAPNGGESWASGTSHTITWTSSNLTENVKIELNRSYPSSTWELLTASTANSGSYNWAVSGTASATARIRITGTSHTTVGDTSNTNFAITTTTPPPAPSITVSSPNGGESWTSGTVHAITWTSASLSENVQIELCRNYPGTTWEIITTSVPNTGSCSWTVSGAATTAARVRVRGTTSSLVGDTTNANFTIAASSGTTPTLTVVSPNGGEVLPLYTLYTLRWSTTNLSSTTTVRIQINRNYPYGYWENLNWAAYNTGYYRWTVSGATTRNARIRIVSNSFAAAQDVSNGSFTITSGGFSGGGSDGPVTDLGSAYPNPFNPTTQIRFNLAEAVHVKLDVFDITGRHVATLLDAEQEAGTHNITLDGTNLASGIYIVRMRAGEVQKLQKINLLK